MDFGTVLGLSFTTALLILSILLAPGAKLSAFVDYPSIVMVLFGSASTILIAFPFKQIMKFVGVIKKTVFNKEVDVTIVIEQIVALAESARREGLLSLENHMEEINDPFLKLGVRMAIDGMGADIVESIMRTEIDAVAGRHEGGKALLDAYAKYCPAFGMIGTLVGLIIMLGNMNPDTIGTGMAVALLTTLYGAIAANAVFLPLGDKLAFYSGRELLRMEITVRGVIAIQAGENPRVIKQKLMTFVPPAARPAEEEGA
ncbi:MAG: motility protein A [Thermoguttaceae bacterium]